MLTHLLFIAFVAIAVYAQSVTGFALALILLGLVGLFDLVPLPEAVNAVTVLIIVNAVMFFYHRRVARVEPAIIPAVVTSLLGTLLGIAILMFLAANAYEWLRVILGLCVISCAILLWRAASPLERPSGRSYFAGVGALSGVLGGMFSAAGPPLVYAVYRQPWPLERIQESLIFSFAAGAVLRLIVVFATGSFSSLALLLTLEAIPVTLLVTALSAKRAPPVPKETIKHIVCGLLIVSGVGMLISSAQGIFN